MAVPASGKPAGSKPRADASARAPKAADSAEIAPNGGSSKYLRTGGEKAGAPFGGVLGFFQAVGTIPSGVVTPSAAFAVAAARGSDAPSPTTMRRSSLPASAKDMLMTSGRSTRFGTKKRASQREMKSQPG